MHLGGIFSSSLFFFSKIMWIYIIPPKYLELVAGEFLNCGMFVYRQWSFLCISFFNM